MAAEVTSEANDKQQAVPMAQAALDNLNAAGIERPRGADGKLVPIPNTADSGYFSEKAVEGTEKIGMDPHFAVGRQKHHEAPIPPPATVLSAEADVKGEDAAETAFGDRQGLVRGTQAHRRAGIRPDQVGAGNPQVSVTRAGKGVGRMAIDLLDAQPAEDLASVQQCRRGLMGIVRARAGPRPKGRGPAKTEGQCRNIREFSDTLLVLYQTSNLGQRVGSIRFTS